MTKTKPNSVHSRTSLDNEYRLPHAERTLAEHRSLDVSLFQWSSWIPTVTSTLVFIRRDQEVLLIDKKTGLGKGKVNGPGGKVESGESWTDCARREVREELNIEVGSLTWGGELRFLMTDYPDILCHVFFTDHYRGTPIETREARPFWSPLSEIPYANMWVDDQYWLPRALLGETILGLFSFEGEELLSSCVKRHPLKEPPFDT